MPRKSKEATRIVFVEPDAFLGRIYKTKAQLEGYAVEVVPSVKRMLTIVQKKPVSVIVADMSVGIEGLMEQVKSNTKAQGIPVIVTTPYAMREDVASLRACGAAACVITTHSTLTELLSVIKKFVHS